VGHHNHRTELWIIEKTPSFNKNDSPQSRPLGMTLRTTLYLVHDGHGVIVAHKVKSVGGGATGWVA